MAKNSAAHQRACGNAQNAQVCGQSRVYRKTRWIALFSTGLTLSVEQIIEYCGARWKIEAAFKELKQDIGSAETQTGHPNAVTNHLLFCMMAMSVVWIYACRLGKTPHRRHKQHWMIILQYFARRRANPLLILSWPC